MSKFSENQSPWLTFVQQQAAPGAPAAGLFRFFLTAANTFGLIDSAGNSYTLGATGTNGVDGIDGLPGVDGTNGTNGTNGVGVPVGGITGQALIKNSPTDYDTKWGTVASGGGGSGGGGGGTTPVYIQLTTPWESAPLANGVWADVPGMALSLPNVPAGATVKLHAVLVVSCTGNSQATGRIVRTDGTVIVQADPTTATGGNNIQQTATYYNQGDPGQEIALGWDIYDTAGPGGTQGYKIQVASPYPGGQMVCVNKTGRDNYANVDARSISTFEAVILAGTGGGSSEIWNTSVGVPALSAFTQVDPTPCATFSENPGRALGIQIVTAHPNVPNIVGLFKPAPVAPYSVAILCLYSAPKVPYNGISYGWHDPISGKFDVCAFEQDGYNYGQTYESQNYTNPTTRQNNGVVGTNPNWMGPIWMHLTDDGTNIKWGYSMDGFNIVPMYSFVKANGYLAGANTNLFIGMFPDGEAGNSFINSGLSILCWDEDGEIRSINQIG